MTANPKRKWCEVVCSPDDGGWYGYFVEETTGDYTGVESGIMSSEIDVMMWARQNGATHFFGQE